MWKTFTNSVAVSLLFILVWACGNSDYTPVKADMHGYTGTQSCVSCHQKEYKAWTQSHHFYAMQQASDSTVLADFNNTAFVLGKDTFLFFKKEDLFFVKAKVDGVYKVFEIEFTFGFTPLQQYIVKFPKGKYQALTVAWDVEQKKWFNVQDQIVESHDWLHWSKQANSWNMMCADCHTTNFKKGVLENGQSYKSRWTEDNVACEACHGSGEDHINAVNSGEYNKNESHLTFLGDQEHLIGKCAKCHSFREQIEEGEDLFSNNYRMNLMNHPSYYPDGQINGEVYETGSFMQSKMYHRGVSCTNCHDAHTYLLKEKGNQLCLQCHAPDYQKETHTHHKTDAGSQCVDCHMPGKYYMGVDFRRDHSLRIPRPDLSVKYGTPNACANCHKDISNEKLALAVEGWFGKERPSHFSETLLELFEARNNNLNLSSFVLDDSIPEIVRASVIKSMSFQSVDSLLKVVNTLLHYEDVLLKREVISLLKYIPFNERISIAFPLLENNNRSIRLAAYDVLFEAPDHLFNKLKPETLEDVKLEYEDALKYNEDFTTGQMNIALYYERTGELKLAEQAYKQAILLDYLFIPAHVNLAMLYNTMGNFEEAEHQFQEVLLIDPNNVDILYSLGLLLVQSHKNEKAIAYLETAAEFEKSSRIYYNLGLCYFNIKREQKAIDVLKKGLTYEPESIDLLNALALIYLHEKKIQECKVYAKKIIEIAPDSKRGAEWEYFLLSN